MYHHLDDSHERRTTPFPGHERLIPHPSLSSSLGIKQSPTHSHVWCVHPHYSVNERERARERANQKLQWSTSEDVADTAVF